MIWILKNIHYSCVQGQQFSIVVPKYVKLGKWIYLFPDYAPLCVKITGGLVPDWVNRLTSSPVIFKHLSIFNLIQTYFYVVSSYSSTSFLLFHEKLDLKYSLYLYKLDFKDNLLFVQTSFYCRLSLSHLKIKRTKSTSILLLGQPQWVFSLIVLFLFMLKSL